MREKAVSPLRRWSFKSLVQWREYLSALRLILKHYSREAFFFVSSSHAKLFHSGNNLGRLNYGQLLQRTNTGSWYILWWEATNGGIQFIVALRLAPMPPVRMHSSTIRTQCVFFTDWPMVYMSNGFNERISMICGSYPLFTRVLAACKWKIISAFQVIQDFYTKD
jgi:hypothetical protein